MSFAIRMFCMTFLLVGCTGLDIPLGDDEREPDFIGIILERPDAATGVVRAAIPYGSTHRGRQVALDSAPWGLEKSRSWSRQTSLVSVKSWSRTNEFWYAWWLLDAFSIHRERLSNPMLLPDRDPTTLYAAMGSERFTAYISPDSAAKFELSLSGATVDSILGMRFSPFWTDTLVVADLAGNGVAKEKGIRRKDRILAINGMAAFPVDSAWKRLMTLPRSSDIVLTVRHSDESVEIISMRPRPAHFASVWFDTLGVGNAYLNIDLFVSDKGFETGPQVQAAVAALKGVLKSDGWLILDLRGNPGGEIENSLQAASAFLPAGDTLIHLASMDLDTITLGGRASHSWPKSAGGAFPAGVNLAILANGGSASASEIMISALRENFRSGKIRQIGSTTYGKGIGQSVLSTPAGGYAKITSLDISPVHAPAYHLKGIAPTDSVADGSELEFAMGLFKTTVTASRKAPSSSPFPRLDRLDSRPAPDGAWLRRTVP
ncbi:MAG: hypothetical protein RL318_2852 [Fibrobacterota bacterium]